jgi:membrane-associated phospholipid phosphatase
MGDNKLFWVLFFLIFIAPGYFILNQIGPFKEPHQIGLLVDNIMRFDIRWVFIYCFVFTFSFLPVTLIKDTMLFRKVVFAYTFLFLLTYIFFIFFPVKITRPNNFLVNDFSTWGVKTIFHFDKPINCFPSLHLGQAFLASFITLKIDGLTGGIALIIAGLIGLSTMKLKQHYFLDVISGIVLAYISYKFFVAKYTLTVSNHPRRTAGYILIGYIIFVGFMFILYKLNINLWEY